MKAITIPSFGGPHVLRLADRPSPRPGPGEVLIDVAAAGVNRPDLMQRAGHYPPPPGASDVPGLEVAGRIAACGEADAAGPPHAASGRVWQPGDLVCALVAGGGYADQCVAPGVQCLPVPPGLALADAAALPETVFTVWTNVFDQGRLASGEWLLVHGGSSGIGTTAIQLAVARGAQVIATARSEAKCRACEALGASAVNYRAEDFVAAARRLTSGRGVDVILDMVGGSYVARNLEALAPFGRLLQIAMLESATATIRLSPVLQKRLTITGSTLRSRTPAEKGAIAAALEQHVWPLVAAGALRPVIDSRFPLADAARAHERLESGEAIGKIVLLAG
jgi:putative PIG3 family NAD(P)H quinone oxidoreductase